MAAKDGKSKSKKRSAGAGKQAGKTGRADTKPAGKAGKAGRTAGKPAGRGNTNRKTYNIERRHTKVPFEKPGNFLYPIPAVMVSCGTMEKPNIITIAWTGTICSDPAMVSISVRPERFSYDIIKESGEFVINLTTRRLLRACDYCGVVSGRDVDKFAETHLTPADSVKVACPSIAESPVSIECKVKDVIPLGSHDMFLAEVAAVTVDSSFIDSKGRFAMNETDLTCYSHGTYLALGKALGTFGFSVRKKRASKKTR